MRLTTHFSIEEFTRTRHADLQQKNIDEATQYLHYMLEVAKELEKIRMFLHRPVHITSGFRCKELNDRIGGSPTSQHMVGQAADFTVQDFSDIGQGLPFVFEWCRRHLDLGQLILERPEGRKPWIHFGLPREGREPEVMVFENGAYKKV